MTATHTDSPCLRLRPRAFAEREGYHMVRYVHICCTYTCNYAYACITASMLLYISQTIGASWTQGSVECYGGGLWHTWFDRGLGLAGKVILKNGEVYIDALAFCLGSFAVFLLNLVEFLSGRFRVCLILFLEAS